jgi:hypothetical protein
MVQPFFTLVILTACEKMGLATLHVSGYDFSRAASALDGFGLLAPEKNK